LILIAKPFLTFWVKFYQFIEPPGINFRKGIETILFQAQWTVIVFFLFSLNVINLRAEQYWKGCMKRMYICEYIRKYLHVYLFFFHPLFDKRSISLWIYDWIMPYTHIRYNSLHTLSLVLICHTRARTHTVLYTMTTVSEAGGSGFCINCTCEWCYSWKICSIAIGLFSM